MKDLSIILETENNPTRAIEALRSIYELSEEFDVHLIDYSTADHFNALKGILDRERIVPRAGRLSHNWSEPPGKFASFRDLVAVQRVENPFVLFVTDLIRFRRSTRIKRFLTFLESDTPRIVIPKIWREGKVYRHAGFFEYDRMRKIERVIGSATLNNVRKHPLMSKASAQFTVNSEAFKVELGGRFFATSRELMDINQDNGAEVLSWDQHLTDPAEAFFSKADRLGVEVLYVPDIEIDILETRSPFEKMLDFGLEKIVGSSKYDLLGT